MHEFSIAQEFAGAIAQEGRKAGAKRILRLEIHVGRYRAIVPETLAECLKWILADTVAEGAEIEIVEIPVRARCPQCDEIREMEDLYLVCSECGSLCPEVLSGKELLLYSMEIED
ncbi:MAG TPA: hydrogenase maturation nickel metallochaperone HypA [bacterium]|nr:hydrogenase maturation nickel metallochaperone HypA [bacterium]HQL61073.1 hydrogenase maturation nickel metallochaperone HypA [bacterium]